MFLVLVSNLCDLLSFSTNLIVLKNDNLKIPEDLEKMKDASEISSDQYRILKGFMANLDRVHMNPQPSELDKRTVAKAYYNGILLLFFCTYVNLVIAN